MNPLLLAVALCLVPIAQAQVEEPPNTGVYVKVSDRWISLEPIRAAGRTTKHLARLFLPGLPPQVVWSFRGTHAALRIFGNSVQLFVRDVPDFDERNVVIVKFTVKNDHRELQTTSAGNFSTFKAGFSRKQAPEFEVHKTSDHAYSIIPTERLSPGEYLITIGPGMIGYDFAVQ